MQGFWLTRYGPASLYMTTSIRSSHDVWVPFCTISFSLYYFAFLFLHHTYLVISIREDRDVVYLVVLVILKIPLAI